MPKFFYEISSWPNIIKSFVSVIYKCWGNEGKSAACFCRQMAAWFPDIYCNFYSVKHYKIAKNSTTTEAREKINTDLGIIRILDIFDVCLN